MKLLIRFCAALMSAYIFTEFGPNPARMVWVYLDCVNDWSQFCETYSSRHNEITLALKLSAVILWLAFWFHLEMKNRSRMGRTPKVLTHLRYGPIATLIIAIAAIISTDALLIQYSRWEIMRYINSNASVFEEPSFKVHNNYRGWCGNGYAAAKYELYGDVPVKYFESPDPAIRVRALRASMEVYDWINYSVDGPSISLLGKALNDPDPLVRQVALEYKAELFGEPTDQ